MPKLKYLDLRFSRLSNDAAVAVADALCHAPQLGQLFLSGNREVEDTGTQAIANALHNVPQLTKLGLLGCGMERPGAEALLASLKHVQELGHLSFSQMDGELLVRLCQDFEQLPKLNHLVVEARPCGYQVNVLAALITRLPALQSLGLACNFSKEDVAVIAKAICSAKRLEHVTVNEYKNVPYDLQEAWGSALPAPAFQVDVVPGTPLVGGDTKLAVAIRSIRSDKSK